LQERDVKKAKYKRCRRYIGASDYDPASCLGEQSFIPIEKHQGRETIDGDPHV